MECAKTYFRNVAKQKGARDDRMKYDRAIQEGQRRGRRQGVSNKHI